MEVLTWVMRELAIYPRVDTIPFTVLQDTKLEEDLRKRKKYKHASDEFRANFRVLKSGPLKITEFPAFEDLDFTHVDRTRQSEYQWSVQPLRYVKGWRFALARRLCKVRRAKKSKKRTSSKISGAEIGDIQSESVAALPTSPEPIASIEKTSDRGHISPRTSEQAGGSDLVSLSTLENMTSPTMPPTSPAVDKAFDKENASPLSNEDGESSRLEEEASCREAAVISNHEACCACPTVRGSWICITCPVHPVRLRNERAAEVMSNWFLNVESNEKFRGVNSDLARPDCPTTRSDSTELYSIDHDDDLFSCNSSSTSFGRS